MTSNTRKFLNINSQLSHFLRTCSVSAGVLWLAALLCGVALPASAVTSDSNGMRVDQHLSLESRTQLIQGTDTPALATPSIFAEMAHALEADPYRTMRPALVAGPAVAIGANTTENTATQNIDERPIAVIYPDIGEPYRSVFTQILNGIQDKTQGRVSTYAIGPNVDAVELNNTLRMQKTRVVIALGQQGAKLAATLDGNLHIVVGGVLTGRENTARHMQVNVLSPDPALLFEHIKDMMPRLRRISAVYDPRQNSWMMRLAKEAARNQGLEFTAYEAQDLRTAIKAYHKIFENSDSSRDALWLPQDSTTVEEGTVLPLVLQESWDRNLAVFSSNFGHVSKGVLFSLFPDNVELGRHLAASALDFLTPDRNEMACMLPLKEVSTAVNLRTARHLGIHTRRPQNFDMTFPE